jgi:hypothetical protein
MKNMQEYVGQEIIGFVFTDNDYIDYSYEHEDYVGVVGTIVEVEKDGDDEDYSCRVEFPNNEEGEWYPMKNIDNHIVNPVDLDQLFNQIKSL